MSGPGRETTVGWALFLWDGRIGRRIFILGESAAAGVPADVDAGLSWLEAR